MTAASLLGMLQPVTCFVSTVVLASLLALPGETHAQANVPKANSQASGAFSRRLALTRSPQLERSIFQQASGKQTSRLAATTVLTEHPSSLRLLKRQLGELRRAMRDPASTAEQLLKQLQLPYMTTSRQAHEFRNISLRRGLATAKMIDFEGKPMPPGVIPRYVKAIEQAGMTAGMEGDRLLYIRLPGAAEKSEKDRTLRTAVFQTIVSTNLERVLAGRALPLDRLIVPDTKQLDELIEVHRTYDQLADAAVDQAVSRGQLAAGQRVQVLRQLKQIQAVPLVEDADTVINAHKMVRSYLDFHQARYQHDPKHLVLFVAGSDLNREIGPVAGQIARSVMRGRLARLQQELPQVDLVPWIGIGSGPMRSGVGKQPQLAAKLHPGMTVTIQPDQLDQPNLEQTIAAMGKAALSSKPAILDEAREQRLIALGAVFADVHARLSLQHALSTVRVANLLAPINQRGRKQTSANLLYEKDGELFLRAVHPKEVSDGSTYGRQLVVEAYEAQVPAAFPGQKQALARRQRTLDKLWPKGLADPRAITGAFARYVQGEPLTTVAGLGRAIKQAEASLGTSELDRLRPFIKFLVQNDGFVLTKNRDLLRKRITVSQPGLKPAQVERRLAAYFADLAELERFLGHPVETQISLRERALYERATDRLYGNPHFVSYLRGQDLSLKNWLLVMQDLVQVLSNPGWNRIG